MWWRVFIPSWRFYDRIGSLPRLYARAHDAWIPIFAPIQTPWYGLLFNPKGNQQLAYQSLLERFVVEASGAKKPEELVSYKILAEACASELKRLGHLQPGEQFNFKIQVGGEDVILSPFLRAEP